MDDAQPRVDSSSRLLPRRAVARRKGKLFQTSCFPSLEDVVVNYTDAPCAISHCVFNAESGIIHYVGLCAADEGGRANTGQMADRRRLDDDYDSKEREA